MAPHGPRRETASIIIHSTSTHIVYLSLQPFGKVEMICGEDVGSTRVYGRVSPKLGYAPQTPHFQSCSRIEHHRQLNILFMYGPIT